MAIDPLVPANVDLQDFEFMPIDVLRLRDSGLALKESDAAFKAAVLLWCAAWHQVPAGSLPDDEDSLAKYAGCSVRKWRRIRDGALRGFQLCTDGRLHHRTLATKVLQSWDGKLKHRHKKECERIKKAAQRADAVAVYPSFDEWKEQVAATGNDRWQQVSRGTDEGQARDVPRESHSLKGECKGQGEGQGEEKPSASGSFNLEASTQVPTSADLATRACVLMEEAGCKSTNRSRAELIAAITEGITPEVLADTASEAVKAGKTNPFAWAIKTARARHAEGMKPINGRKSKPATPSESPIERRAPADPQIASSFMAKIRAGLGMA